MWTPPKNSVYTPSLRGDICKGWVFNVLLTPMEGWEGAKQEERGELDVQSGGFWWYKN